MKTDLIRLYENREDVTLTCYLWDDSPELLNGKTVSYTHLTLPTILLV